MGIDQDSQRRRVNTEEIECLGFRAFDIKIYEGIREVDIWIPEAVIKKDDLYRISDVELKVRSWSSLDKRFRKPVWTFDGCLLGLITNGGRKLQADHKDLVGIEGFAFSDNSLVLQTETKQHELLMQFNNIGWGVKGKVENEPLGSDHELRTLMESKRNSLNPEKLAHTWLCPTEFSLDTSERSCRINFITAVTEHYSEEQFRNVRLEITDWETLYIDSVNHLDEKEINLGEACLTNLTQEEIEDTCIEEITVRRPGEIAFMIDIRDQASLLSFKGASISLWGEHYGEFGQDYF